MVNWLLFNGPVVRSGLQAFARMLVYSLWQGLLLGIAAAMVILFTKKAHTATRYNIIGAMFFIYLAVCLFTFFNGWAGAEHSELTGQAAFSLPVLPGDSVINYLTGTLVSFFSANANLVVMVWFIFFILKCLKMFVGLGYINRIKNNRFRQADDYWKDKLAKLSGQLHIKKAVLLVESGITKIPLVIGHFKPVIYMPLGLMANLPQEQVEAVLLHELAHIRRNDYLVNLLQHVAEIVFFFNPGLLWVSSVMKREREHCCDDTALKYTHGRKPFIEALVSFTKHSLYGSSYATAFPGSKNHLVQRVKRIAQNRNGSLNRSEKIFLCFSITVCVVLGIVSANKQAHLPKNTHLQLAVTKSASFDNPSLPAAKTPALTEPEITKEVQTQEPKFTNAVFVENSTGADDPAEIKQEQQNEINPLLVAKEQAMKDAEQADAMRLQADKDKVQAGLDRKQAELDRQQAVEDREQAERDRAQAELDKKQADRDRVKADDDRQQAMKDRIRADNERRQAELYREQAIKERQQFIENKIPS